MLKEEGKVHACMCIKEDYLLPRGDVPSTYIKHKVGDICSCKEMLDENNNVIGYYVLYDIYRFRCFDFNEYYKIID